MIVDFPDSRARNRYSCKQQAAKGWVVNNMTTNSQIRYDSLTSILKCPLGSTHTHDYSGNLDGKTHRAVKLFPSFEAENIFMGVMSHWPDSHFDLTSKF